MGCDSNCTSNRRYSTKAIDYTYSQFAEDNTNYTLDDVKKVSNATEFSEADQALCDELKDYSVCVGYKSGNTYVCPGHRRADIARTINYALDYNTGDLLSCNQPEKIRSALHTEIEQRKKHLLYANELKVHKSNIEQIKTGTIVDNIQPNDMSQSLSALNDFVKNTTNVAKKLNNKKGDYKWKSSYRNNTQIQSALTTAEGEYAKSNDIKCMQPAVSADYIDCICYSDCTYHGRIHVKYCSCNIACGCNY